ncbi:MAG TPA: 2-C-methyl-D-erythritol 2,4-cyclodiphosphate synthase, partial [Vicinamibacterales bacterium]|nr:2-C-methyl-D-erythritol 2,4-cyclodiphosphate synthase [Vicinamibacterales bacterium]
RDVLDRLVALGELESEATDEAVLAERLGQPVRVVLGDAKNVKITTPEDLTAARAAMAVVPRVGTGYDLHRLEPGRPLVLAGVTISTELGPVSHSDGDVLCHALIDAMLGAAGAGDIGKLFPNTDAAWKDASGLDLLARADTALRAKGWRVSNADVTIVLERPRLGPSIDAIRGHVARVLGIGIEQVSVKAKTNEQVDAVGRGEAIAAHAIAMLVSGAGA